MKNEQKLQFKKEIKKRPPQFSWRAAEYDFYQKGWRWYLIVGGGALVMLLIAFWQKNFFFAIFIILALIVVVAFGNRRPQVFEFSIYEDGIVIGKDFFSFDGLESFSLRVRPHRLDEIIFKKKKTFNPYLRLPIDAKSAAQVKTILIKKLNETEYHESIIDLIAEWLGF